MDHKYDGLFLDSQLYSFNLCLCQYYIVLITVVLYLVLKLRSVSLSILFFFFKIVLSIPGPLHVQENFRTSSLISAKKAAAILAGIVLNL